MVKQGLWEIQHLSSMYLVIGRVSIVEYRKFCEIEWFDSYCINAVNAMNLVLRSKFDNNKNCQKRFIGLISMADLYHQVQQVNTIKKMFRHWYNSYCHIFFSCQAIFKIHRQEQKSQIRNGRRAKIYFLINRFMVFVSNNYTMWYLMENSVWYTAFDQRHSTTQQQKISLNNRLILNSFGCI